jgi:hypothetical protein
MITTSNSSMKRSGLPNQFLDVLLHTIACSELARVTSVNGFISDGVSLVLSGCPPSATCNVTQPQGMIIPTSTGSFPLTVMTQTCSTAQTLPPSPVERWPVTLCFGTMVVAAIFGRRMGGSKCRSRRQRYMVWMMTTLAALAITSCSGNGTHPPPCSGGTPAGNYTVSITATSGGASHSANLALTVQ